MAVGGQTSGINPLALSQLWQAAFGVICLATGEVIDGLDVGLQETRERNGAPTGGEGSLTAIRGIAGDPQAQRGPAGVGHLRGDGPLPDQFVQTEPIGIELGVESARRGESLAGRPDRLVGLLGVLHLAGVLARRWMDVFVTIELARLVTRGVDRRLRQRGRVGPHVGDVAVLVELLGHAHRALSAEPQLAASLLLKRRCHERRVRAAGVGLLLHRGDSQRRTFETRCERAGSRLVEHEHLVGLAHHTQGVEVPSAGHPLAIDCH